MVDVFPPLFQLYVAPPLAVSVMFGLLQVIIAEDGLTAALGVEFTLTVLDAVAIQPLDAVTVTVYVVVNKGDTVMDAVAAPLLQL